MALGCVLALSCQSVLAQALYRITPLDSPGTCTAVMHALNRADQVAGSACNGHNDTHAFLWNKDGSGIDLGPSAVGSRTQANALNASGLAAGWGTDTPTGNDFGFVSSGHGAPLTRIPNSIVSGADVRAYALNDSGQVTGEAAGVRFYYPPLSVEKRLTDARPRNHRWL